MRGSMRERRPGVWELIVQLPRDPTSARAGQLSRTVHGTKREAQRALAGLIGEVEVLTAADGAEQHTVLGHVLQTWADTAGIDLHIADRRPPALQHAGIELGL